MRGMYFRSTIARFLGNESARQSGVLIGGHGVAMISSFVLTILIARGLDVATFGTFRYAMTFLAFGTTLLQFGVPYSVARLLALETDPSVQKEIVGAGVIFVAASTMAGIIVALAVVFGAEAFGYGLPQILVWVAPALCVTLGQYMIGRMCQGLNRISLLSSQQILPYVILVPVTAVQLFALRQYSLAAAIIGYVATFILVTSVGFLQLGIAFGRWQSWLRVIVRENSRTGFPIYIGGIFAVASGHLIAMWVVAFVDPIEYGRYALALGVSAPLGILVSSVGTVIFRLSSRSDALPKAIIIFSLGLGVLLGLVYLAATEYLLVWAFGDEYSPAVQMAQLLGLGSLMLGWGDVLQRFLGAHGLGKRLGIASVFTGLIGIGAAALLMRKWAAYGAIVASLMAAATYLGSMIFLYICYINSREFGAMPTPSSGRTE